MKSVEKLHDYKAF